MVKPTPRGTTREPTTPLVPDVYDLGVSCVHETPRHHTGGRRGLTTHNFVDTMSHCFMDTSGVVIHGFGSICSACGVEREAVSTRGSCCYWHVEVVGGKQGSGL